MLDELDRNIPAASHRFMAERAGSRRTVEIAGGRPERGSGTARWRAGARAIEDHRERHGISDPARALGPEPDDPHLLAERRPVERAVEEVQSELSYLARALERPGTGRPGPGYDPGPRHDLGQGMERGVDHGPSLGMGR